jgi:hypothetical protein
MGAKRKNKRRFAFLLHKYQQSLYIDKDSTIQAEIEILNEYLKSYGWDKKLKERYSESIEFFKLCIKFEFSVDIINLIIAQHKKLSQKNNEFLTQRPKLEGRDNKAVHVGSGGSHSNKIRYPKKNRSRKTWSNFYKLFPNQAIADGWDGKTSKKM